MQAKTWLKYFDYFFITRPMLFFPGWNTLLAGFLVVRKDIDYWQNFISGEYHAYLWDQTVFFTALAFMFAMGSSFILNQLQDVESDRKNRKLFLIGEKCIPKRNATWESLILGTLSLLISIQISRTVFLLNLAFILITGYLYNFRPFKFKDYSFRGLLLNMIMGWIAFALGWVTNQDFNINLILRSIPYLFFNTGLYFLTTIPDAEGDKIARKETFCVRYGINTTVYFSFVCYAGSIISALFLNDQLLLLVSLPAGYWFFNLLFTRSVSSAIKTIKISIFLFSMVIVIKMPLYFFLMLLVFLLTKYYYFYRFQFDYPNFRGE